MRTVSGIRQNTAVLAFNRLVRFDKMRPVSAVNWVFEKPLEVPCGR